MRSSVILVQLVCKPLDLKHIPVCTIKVINGRWWKAKILPYEPAMAAYGAAIAGLPSQIAYGGWRKIRPVIPP